MRGAVVQKMVLTATADQMYTVNQQYHTYTINQELIRCIPPINVINVVKKAQPFIVITIDSIRFKTITAKLQHNPSEKKEKREEKKRRKKKREEDRNEI